MRNAPAGQFLSAASQTGRVLQTFTGTATAASVTSSSNTGASSGYPANSPFVKLRNESLLRVVINCDFVNPSSPSSTVWIGLYVDGTTDQENIGVASSAIGSDTSSASIILDGLKWTAGSHTVEVKFWNTQSKSITLLCNGSCDFKIIEYLP